MALFKKILCLMLLGTFGCHGVAVVENEDTDTTVIETATATGDADTDSDADSDADTDIDTDTDTDTDSDSDQDTDSQTVFDSDSEIEPDTDWDWPCTWERVYPDLTNAEVSDVWVDTNGDAYVVGKDLAVVFYKGQQLAHLDVPSGGGTHVWGFGPSDVFIADSDNIYHFDGVNWSDMPLPPNDDDIVIRGIWGSDPDNVYAIANPASYLRYDGISWEYLELKMPEKHATNLRSIHGSGPNHIYVTWSNFQAKQSGVKFFDGTSFVEFPYECGDPDVKPQKVFANSDSDMYIAKKKLAVSPKWYACEIYHVKDGECISIQTPPFEGVCDKLWSNGQGELYVNADLNIFRFDGVEWSLAVSGYDYLNALSGNSTGDVWAVGRSGQILHGNGDVWQSPSGFNSRFNDVHATTETVYVAGSQLYQGKDASWSETHLDTPNKINAVWAGGTDDIYAAGSGSQYAHNDGAGWKTHFIEHELGIKNKNACAMLPSGQALFSSSTTRVDGTAEHAFEVWDNGVWSLFPAQPGNLPFSQLWASSISDIYGVDHATNALWHFDGVEWSLVSALIDRQISHLFGNGQSEVYVIADNREVLLFNGANWQTLGVVDGNHYLRLLWANDPKNVYVVANEDTVLHYDGSAWSVIDEETTQKSTVKRTISTLWGTGSSSVFIAQQTERMSWGNGHWNYTDEHGSVMHYNGSNWTEMKVSENTRDYGQMRGTSEDSIVLIGPNPGIAARFDGVAWTEQETGIFDKFDKLCGAANTPLLAYNKQGSLAQFQSGQWTLLEDGNHCTEVGAIWGDGNGNLFFGCTFGGIIRFDKTAWTQLPRISSESIRSIGGSDARNVIAVDGSEQALYFNGETLSHLQLQGAEELHDVWAGPSGEIFVADRAGSVFHFNGLEWNKHAFDGDSTIRQVFGFGPNNIYTVGGETASAMLHYNGERWFKKDVDVFDNRSISGFTAQSPFEMYAVSRDRIIFKTVCEE